MDGSASRHPQVETGPREAIPKHTRGGRRARCSAADIGFVRQRGAIWSARRPMAAAGSIGSVRRALTSSSSI